MMRGFREIIVRHVLAAAISSILILASAASVAAKDDAREQSKPIYLRDIQIGDTTLPFSPVTVVITILSLIMLSGLFSWNKVSATASHILLDDSDAEAKLTKLKKDIGNDYAKFQAAAKQYSKCPSGKSSGGSLGSFKPGMMVPAFDRAIFAKESKVHEVIGPIQTVRYHLYMHHIYELY
jgi:peptidyl-prolyl cis-trans isomerase C